MDVDGEDSMTEAVAAVVVVDVDGVDSMTEAVAAIVVVVKVADGSAGAEVVVSVKEGAESRTGAIEASSAVELLLRVETAGVAELPAWVAELLRVTAMLT